LRRVSISPLGVSRRVTPRPPRAWRLVPLLAGLGELAWFVHAGRPDSTPRQIQAYLTGILLTMAGLVIAGPWLTMAGSRLTARRTGRPAMLIAGRRLSDNPRAGFRAISGLVLALFVASVAIGVITTIDAYDGGANVTAAEQHTLIDRFTIFTPGEPHGFASLPGSLLGELHSTAGVHGVTVIHADPNQDPNNPLLGVVSCAELAATPVLGRCPAGADTATLGDVFRWSQGGVTGRVWPPADLSVERLQQLPAQAVVVATDGSAAVERARTVLGSAYPYRYTPTTISEELAQNANTRRTAAYRQLANVVILTSLVIAGCSLAVSVVGGLNDRKRPFSLLRLTGAPLGVLRRVIALETAVPLLVLAVVSIATGFVAAGLFLSSQLSEQLQPPGVQYYLVVLAGLVASLAIIASILPILRRITGPETARNE
jgi:FtsX-like permease family